MWDSSSSDNYYGRNDAIEILKQIKELKDRGGRITINESKKLIELQDKLHKTQEKCMHFWSIILLFNKHSRFCKFCDKEDTAYKHES